MNTRTTSTAYDAMPLEQLGVVVEDALGGDGHLALFLTTGQLLTNNRHTTALAALFAERCEAEEGGLELANRIISTPSCVSTKLRAAVQEAARQAQEDEEL